MGLIPVLALRRRGARAVSPRCGLGNSWTLRGIPRAGAVPKRDEKSETVRSGTSS
jgi:hypothetical protein